MRVASSGSAPRDDNFPQRSKPTAADARRRKIISISLFRVATQTIPVCDVVS